MQVFKPELCATAASQVHSGLGPPKQISQSSLWRTDLDDFGDEIRLVRDADRVVTSLPKESCQLLHWPAAVLDLTLHLSRLQ